jgi:hypothetical protein
MSLQEQILAAETALQAAEQKERDTVNEIDALCRLLIQTTIDAKDAGRIVMEKQKHLDALQTMLAEKEKETPIVEKKKRRKPMSVALKARRQKEYGLAWRALNPTYAHESYEHMKAWCRGSVKWENLPKPKLNPLTPAKAKALQDTIDSRPPQSSDSSATRKVPLETVL